MGRRIQIASAPATVTGTSRHCLVNFCAAASRSSCLFGAASVRPAVAMPRTMATVWKPISVAAGWRRPSGVIAVANFSGGRAGNPDEHPGQPCFAGRMADAIEEFAPTIEVPVLSHYVVNDLFFAPAVAHQWFAAFRPLRIVRLCPTRTRLALSPGWRSERQVIYGTGHLQRPQGIVGGRCVYRVGVDQFETAQAVCRRGNRRPIGLVA